MALKVIQNSSIRNTLAVASGKGGVGKSTLAALLACALKRMGEQVGILDGDLYGPSMRHLLPEEKMPEQKEESIAPAFSNGMPLLSMAFFQNETGLRAPLANQILKHFLIKTLWGDLDWLIIDFPPGTGDIPMTLSQETKLSALLVSTPQKLACLDVQKTIHLFQKMKVPILGIIENMSYYENTETKPFGTGEVQKLADLNGIPFLGEIPLDPRISKSADEKRLAFLEIPLIEAVAKKIKNKCREEYSVETFEFLNNKTVQFKRGDTIQHIPASLLQKNCPCAGCKKGPPVVKEDVEILQMKRVGHYALSFNFTSGCSFGLYDFDLLKRII